MTLMPQTVYQADVPVIRDYRPEDRPEVESVYRAGIETGLATLETAPKSQAAFEADSIDGSLIVAHGGNDLSGWAGLWPVSPRACYRGVGEVSVYVAPGASRRGYGSALLQALTARAENLGIWTMQAAILADNQRSIDLHSRAGFRFIGRRDKLGERAGRWHDIILMDKRSQVLGLNAGLQEIPS